MNTSIICERCNRPHPQMVEVKAIAIFYGRRNEWITHFCPKCLAILQEEVKKNE